MPEEVLPRKLAYRARLEGYLEEYKSFFIINVDMVGSKQMQEVRMAMRGQGAILMGKNTIIRKVLRDKLEENPALEKVLPEIYGNVGFVFTNNDLNEIRPIITENKVPAAARLGVLAPIDVRLPSGPTGLDPGQTGFFQAMNIGTKIVRGSIEIITEVHLIQAGTRVSASAAALLAKLNVRPFEYGIKILTVFDNGSVYPVSILDMSDADLLGRFFNGVRKLTAVSLAIGVPNLATLPHSFARAVKKMLAIAVETDITFPIAQKYKDYLADPEAYAAKHGIVAAPAAEAKKEEAAAAPEPEEEESDGDDMGFDLFD